MDEAEQVSWGGSRPGDWDLPGWRRGSMAGGQVSHQAAPGRVCLHVDLGIVLKHGRTQLQQTDGQADLEMGARPG